MFIDTGSSWQNAWIESFNCRLRDELLNSWQFDNLLKAQVLIEDWRVDSNQHRLHRAHGDLTPASSPRPGPPDTNQHSHATGLSTGPSRGDLIELTTDESKLLATVEDLASRRLPSFAIGEHHDAPSAKAALCTAAAIRGG